MSLFYKDVLNYKTVNKIDVFNDYEEEVKNIEKLNSKEKLLKKIKQIIEIRDKIKYNINLNLAMDKLIINLEEVIEND